MSRMQSDAETHVLLGVRSLGHAAAAPIVGGGVRSEPGSLLELDVGDGIYPAS